MALSDSAGVGSALPSQVGVTSGWALTTDGTSASWASVGGGGGVTTMAAVGSTPSANGASISGVTLTLQPASATLPGVATAGNQSFGGIKTFGVSPNHFTLDPTGYGGGPKLSFGTDFFIGSADGVNTLISAGTAQSIYYQSNSNYIFQVTGTSMDFTSGGLGNIKLVLGFTDLSGTPGAGTASTTSGRFAVVASSSATFKITNSLVATGSVILATPITTDATCTGVICAVTSGGFNVTPLGAAAPTGNQQYQFVVFN